MSSAETAAPAPASVAAKALRTGLYAGVFLVALVLWIAFELPDSLVANKVLNDLNQNTPYRWQAQQLRWKFFLRPHLSAEKLELESVPRPVFGSHAGPAPTPLQVTIDEVKLYPSLLSLIPGLGGPKVSFNGRAYDATVEGAAALRGIDVDVTAQNVQLTKLKPLRDQGLDIQGVLQKLALELKASDNDLSKANGEVALNARDLAFDPAVLQLGLPLPPLELGPAELRARVVNGKVEIDRLQVGGPDKDLDLRVTGDVRLNRNVNFSTVSLRMVLKLSKKVQEAMPSLAPLLANMSTLQPDGAYAMRFRGTLSNLGLPQPDK